MSHARFLTSAVRPEQYPVTGLPELALYGRSNCGKSSLINVLTRRKDLVRTSSRPGVTQMVNFFQVDEHHVLTDLPGYGYAQVPEQQRRQFGAMVEEYFRTRRELRLVLLLLDIRRTPSDKDLETLGLLRSLGIRVQIVLTKADKLSGNERGKALAHIARELGCGPADLVVTSSHDKRGLEDVHRLISTL